VTDTIGSGDDAVRVERETELRRLDDGRARSGRDDASEADTDDGDDGDGNQDDEGSDS
jgi:hypothetical protein